MVSTLSKIIEQLFTKKVTNVFPAKHVPDSIVDFLAKGDITAPVPVPDHFRGTLAYDYENCIGCMMCVRICPAKAIEAYPVIAKEKKTKRVVFFLGRCTSCQECVNICPVHVISMEKTFMNANYDKYGDSQVIGIEERKINEIKEPANSPEGDS